MNRARVLTESAGCSRSFIGHDPGDTYGGAGSSSGAESSNPTIVGGEDYLAGPSDQLTPLAKEHVR